MTKINVCNKKKSFQMYFGITQKKYTNEIFRIATQTKQNFLKKKEKKNTTTLLCQI